MARLTRRRLRKRTTRRHRGGGHLSISFPTVKASNSLPTLQQAATQAKPAVQWPATDSLKTLIAWDPDAPAGPAWLHWLVVNCEGTDPSSGTEVTPWSPPTPPSGTHRYIFGVFEQASLISISPPSHREGFDIEAFKASHSLTELARSGFKVKAQAGGSPTVDLTYDNPDAKITVFTMANKLKPTLVELLRSLKRNGYSYRVVGYGLSLIHI